MKKRIPPVAIIFFSFLIAIVVGTLILKLPISLRDGASITWVDSFFISTSAICVTGLTPVANIAETFSVFGKIILAVLIQIGGLGCITVSSFFFLIIGAKLGIDDRYLLKEALNQDKVSNVLKLLKSIMKITLIIELCGAILSFIVFSQYYDILPAIGISLFHSISSFNNAGFDILGSNSLIAFKDNVLLNGITMSLIVLGGLGFIVIIDLLKNKFNYKKLTIHSRIVLLMTLSLIVVGTIGLKVAMKDDMTWLQAVFHSVSARTAGFSTINCLALTTSSVLIMCVLMVIGASPCSTGGGLKTTTVFTIVKSMLSFSRGKQTITNNRRISEESKLKAFTLFFFAISMILMASVLILLIENSNSHVSLSSVLFEASSAFATVGLSMGLTPYLSVGSKFIISILMFFGRIGPITIMGMWNSSWNKPNINNIEYLEEKIIIG